MDDIALTLIVPSQCPEEASGRFDDRIGRKVIAQLLLLLRGVLLHEDMIWVVDYGRGSRLWGAW